MCEPPFVLHGREIIKAGVAAIRVVPTLDVLEDRHRGLGMVAKEIAPKGVIAYLESLYYDTALSATPMRSCPFESL